MWPPSTHPHPRGWLGSHAQMNIWLESNTHTHTQFQCYTDLSRHTPADRMPSDSFLLDPGLSAASRHTLPTFVCCPRRNPLSAQASAVRGAAEKMSGWQIIRCSECQHFIRNWDAVICSIGEQECFLFGYRKHNAAILARALLATANSAASLQLAVAIPLKMLLFDVVVLYCSTFALECELRGGTQSLQSHLWRCAGDRAELVAWLELECWGQSRQPKINRNLACWSKWRLIVRGAARVIKPPPLWNTAAAGWYREKKDEGSFPTFFL